MVLGLPSSFCVYPEPLGEGGSWVSIPLQQNNSPTPQLRHPVMFPFVIVNEAGRLSLPFSLLAKRSARAVKNLSWFVIETVNYRFSKSFSYLSGTEPVGSSRLPLSNPARQAP